MSRGSTRRGRGTGRRFVDRTYVAGGRRKVTGGVGVARGLGGGSSAAGAGGTGACSMPPPPPPPPGPGSMRNTRLDGSVGTMRSSVSRALRASAATPRVTNKRAATCPTMENARPHPLRRAATRGPVRGDRSEEDSPAPRISRRTSAAASEGGTYPRNDVTRPDSMMARTSASLAPDARAISGAEYRSTPAEIGAVRMELAIRSFGRTAGGE